MITEIRAKRPYKIVASLTSFPKRIYSAIETIRTLMNQTSRPDEIVLTLNDYEFVDTPIPIEIFEFEAQGYLRINWLTKEDYPIDIKPFKKLLPVAKAYWDTPTWIATCDDDCKYHPCYFDCLRRVIEYLQNTNVIFTDFTFDRENKFGCQLTGYGNTFYAPNLKKWKDDKFIEHVLALHYEDDLYYQIMSLKYNPDTRLVPLVGQFFDHVWWSYEQSTLKKYWLNNFKGVEIINDCLFIKGYNNTTKNYIKKEFGISKNFKLRYLTLFDYNADTDELKELVPDSLKEYFDNDR